MAKKPALGRGLSNLIPGADTEKSGINITNNPEYQELSITEIEPDPHQPRKRFEERELEELAQTIQSVGLIEPIVVRKKGDRFQIISGERRYRACKLAGYKKIPAVVKQVDDVQALEMGIIENIQREELTPIEEARAYEVWMGQTGLKPAELAERVGKDRSTITNLLRLLKLPQEIQELIEKKILTAGQARPLIGIADRKLLLTLVKRISHEGWSARRVEEEVGRLTEPSRSGSGSTSGEKKDPNIKVLEDKFRTKLTAKVQFVHKKNGAGKMVLHYGNLDDLERILEILGMK